MKEDIGGVSLEMEGSLVEKNGERVRHVEKVGYVKRVIVKKKKPYHSNKVKKHVSNKTLQKLFVSCKETFKGPDTIPSTQHVHKLCHILGMINLFGIVFLLVWNWVIKYWIREWTIWFVGSFFIYPIICN